MKKRVGLSKSRIQLGLRCPKSLYFEVHHPERATPFDEQTLTRLKQGTEVGEFARTLFPGGILIAEGPDQSMTAIRRTKEVIASGSKVIFEAAIAYDGTLIRVDILERKKPSGPWHLIEVKQGTECSDSYIRDAATQVIVARLAGLKIDKVSILHLNRDARFDPKKPRALFKFTDLTQKARALEPSISQSIPEFKKMLLAKSSPKVAWGKHCAKSVDTAYECKFFDFCKNAAGIPSPSVFDLRRVQPWKHFEAGKIRFSQFKPGELSEQNEVLMKAHQTKRPFLSREKMQDLMKGWEKPLHALDFETLSHKIPKFKGDAVGALIPFQFSAMISDNEGAYREVAYLHPDGTDPRKALAEALVKAFPKKGSIVAYSCSFEKQRIADLAARFPKLARALKGISARIVDPLPVLEESYYHPKFNFNYRLKTVAPVILGRSGSYQGLDIRSGAAIQSVYDEYVDSGCSKERRLALREALLTYCRQDSKVTLEIVKWMLKKVGAGHDSE